MASLNSLMTGGYEPDVYDVEPNWVPDIECAFCVDYQEDGEIHSRYFEVFEGEDEDKVFDKALQFARENDTLVFYREPWCQCINPKTGKRVKTPQPMGKDYYVQPGPPCSYLFTACETEDLPF